MLFGMCPPTGQMNGGLLTENAHNQRTSEWSPQRRMLRLTRVHGSRIIQSGVNIYFCEYRTQLAVSVRLHSTINPVWNVSRSLVTDYTSVIKLCTRLTFDTAGLLARIGGIMQARSSWTNTSKCNDPWELYSHYHICAGQIFNDRKFIFLWCCVIGSFLFERFHCN